MFSPMISMPGGAEWIYILLIVILIFGAAKLPELSRAVGQSLRIFKAETKGLVDGDEDGDRDSDTSAGKGSRADTPEQREIEARRVESERISPEQTRRDDTTA